MTEHREVAVEVTIAAPIETVWRALRDRDDVRRWHGLEDPTLDEEIEIIYFREAREEDPGGPDRRLVCGGSVFELTGQGPSTVVRVVMAEPPDSDAWHGWYDDIRHGWFTFVQQLRFFLERHPGQPRRSLFLAGDPVDAGQPDLAALLGLAAGEPGTSYAATLATGEQAAGQVWFRAADQLGVTVDDWRDGLLVVTAGRRPAMAVLSTYGLADEEFAALEQRWQAWWGKHFQAPQPAS